MWTCVHGSRELINSNHFEILYTYIYICIYAYTYTHSHTHTCIFMCIYIAYLHAWRQRADPQLSSCHIDGTAR